MSIKLLPDMFKQIQARHIKNVTVTKEDSEPSLVLARSKAKVQYYVYTSLPCLYHFIFEICIKVSEGLEGQGTGYT